MYKWKHAEAPAAGFGYPVSNKYKPSPHIIYGGDGMISYFSELRYKEVIDIHTGRRLGYVCDAEFDEAEGRLISLITPGRAKFFGLLGREDDYILPWKCIVKLGGDIILVETEADQPRRHREKRKNILTKW